MSNLNFLNVAGLTAGNGVLLQDQAIGIVRTKNMPTL
jgi:hypothetical protein